MKTDNQIESIKAPTLIIIGDKDVIKPGVHGDYIGEITTLESNSKEADFVIPMIEGFLIKIPKDEIIT